MAALLSDDELRRELKSFGVDVGPITPTTRKLYEKKLGTLQGKGSPSLNAFSSDDSDLDQPYPESSISKTHRKKRTSPRNPPTQLNLREKQGQDVFKKPFPTPPRYSPRLSLPSVSSLAKSPPSGSSRSGKQSRKSFLLEKAATSFDVEASDSDFESDALLNPMRTLKLQNKSNHYMKGNESDDYLSVFRRASKSFLSSTPNGEDFNRKSQKPDLKHKDSLESFLRKRYSSLVTGAKPPKECSANGYISDVLNGEFQSGKTASKTTNYSHCVSWMLVLGAVLFFVVIGAFYMSAVQKTQMATSRSYFEKFACANENTSNDCIPRKHLNSAVAATHELHNILSAAAGDYECISGRENRSLSLSDTKAALSGWFATANFEKAEDYDDDVTLLDGIFGYAIFLLLKNPNWGISVFSVLGEEMSDIPPLNQLQQTVSALESKLASKSLMCRLKHSILWTMTTVVIFCLAAAVFVLSFFILKYMKKRKESEEKEFYDLVERIIDILQQSDDGSSSSSGSIPSKAVVHLRDTLIPLKDRKAKQRLWDRVVAFIEEAESRVQVDHERIAGEEFKVWRWLQNPAAASEGGKQGKVWQGQAFGSLSKGKNHVPYSPTRCLKIRNMFDPEVEYGDDWQISIKDAILEKCEGNNGIIHIAVDTSSSEGCIYMLCNSSDAAGKAYGALHGWWFDGKLVTVKFLRLERYLERYPSAADCEEPLKPSNNKRLSLSAPFFSSALEVS